MEVNLLKYLCIFFRKPAFANFVFAETHIQIHLTTEKRRPQAQPKVLYLKIIER